MKTIAEYWWLVLAGCFLMSGALVAAASARADGRVDYCRLLWKPAYGPIKGYWEVEGHRPWRADATLGAFMSDDDARAFAASHNCDLH